MATGTPAGMAAAGIGSSGYDLFQQVSQETDEERRKRLLQMQQQRLLPGSAAGSAASSLNAGYSAALGGY